MITDLQQFVHILRQENDLVEIEVEVDPYLEAAEIHRRVVAANGPAILFKHIKGSPYPLVTNLFGSKQRIELAFGPRPEKLVRDIAALPHEFMPPSLAKTWQMRGTFRDLLRVGLTRHKVGPITQVVETPPKLMSLPLLTTWEKDGGPFITLPLVYTEHPSTGIHNLGMYRIQRYDDQSTGLHIQIGKGGGFHLAEAGDAPLPINISIGGPPALILSAIAPLPENVPELLLASLTLGKRFPLTRNPSGPLPVPTNAEFCLVGEVQRNDIAPEGPFGDHYGYYSLQHDYPVFRCHSLLRKQNPLCAATVVGKPRQEDFYLGDYLQALLSPLFPLVMPQVRDLWSYGETGYHSLSAAVVQERYSREAMVSAFRILGEGQLSLTKFLLLTDHPQDLKDFKAVLTHILERADFRTDLFVFANLSMDTLDYTGPAVNKGSKGVLLGCGDAVRTLPREFSGALPRGASAAEVFSPGCIVVQGPSYEEDTNWASVVASCDTLRDWPLVILADNAQRCAKSSINFLWTVFTRFEPAADIHSRAIEIVRNHLAYRAPIVIDARMKPWYPEELFCDAGTEKLVTQRWNEYFPSGLEMGDSGLGHLD